MKLSKRGRILKGLLLLAGLALALLGQFYFIYYPEFWRDGVLFWCASLLAFGLLLWQERRRERKAVRWWQRPSWITDHPARMVLAISGGLLSLAAGWLARGLPAAADFSPFLWAWLLGSVLFLSAFVPTFSIAEAWWSLKRRLNQRRFELAGLAALLLAALLVRAIDLEHIPANLGGDEGTQGLAALELVEGSLGNPFSTGWFSVPTMSFLAYGVSMQLFGKTVAGLRMLSALVGTVTVLTTYLLARELWGRRVAWLAGVALTFSHYHIHFSRLGSNQIADGLFVTLTLWLLTRGLRLRRAVYFTLAGAAVGLSWYGYFGARLVGIIAALYWGWLLARDCVRGWREQRAQSLTGIVVHHGRGVAIVAAAAMVVAAPLLLYYLDHPDLMSSRAEQVSLFAPGRLEQEQAFYGVGLGDILVWQLWKSISAFHYTHDPTFWYRPSTPLLDFASGVLFIAGMVWAAVKARQRGSTLLLIWFWLALLLGWVATENPPSSQRMVIIAPALALLVGLGLDWLVGIGRRLAADHPRFWNSVAAVLLGSIAILNVQFYFFVYTPTRVYGNPNAEIATELGRYLVEKGDGYAAYFYGPTQMYWDNGNLRFLARHVFGIDVHPGGTPPPAVGPGARYIFLSHRLGELTVIREQFPEGTEQAVYSQVDGRLLYVLYEVALR